MPPVCAGGYDNEDLGCTSCPDKEECIQVQVAIDKEAEKEELWMQLVSMKFKTS